MATYLIRLRLPGRPGALGAVASRIGSVGGDVVSIDILQRGDGEVVDEFGVVLPGDDLTELLKVPSLMRSVCSAASTSRPSASAWSLTRWDPGTTRARSPMSVRELLAQLSGIQETVLL